MLYEALFWSRSKDERPTIEEGLSYDYTKHILADFSDCKGDICAIAKSDDKYAGAAFIRYWTKDINTRGYIADDVPVLVIGVHQNFRQQGIGTKLIESLKEMVKAQGINKISLCVTKSNIAYRLYVKQKFQIIEDIGDSYLMLWE